MKIGNRKDTKNLWKDLVICDLNIKRYLGKWYEIARFPHSFERDLEDVTANYRLLSKDKIEVINIGYRNGIRKEARAKAVIPDNACQGRLRVTFFWPFSSQYNIIFLDKVAYQYAVVVGGGMNYLWILCRDPYMDRELYESLISFVKELGFDVAKIEKVKHSEHKS